MTDFYAIQTFTDNGITYNRGVVYDIAESVGNVFVQQGRMQLSEIPTYYSDERTAFADYDVNGNILTLKNKDGSDAFVGGDRPVYLGAVSATNGLADFIFSGLRNTRSQVPRKFDVRSNVIGLSFNTFQSGSSGENAYQGSVKLEAYVTIRGVSYLLTFNKSRYLEGPTGVTYFSDLIRLPFYYEPGEEYSETVQALWTLTSGSQYLCYRDSPQYFGYDGWSSVYKSSGTWIDMTVTNGVVDTPSAVDGFATTNDNNYFGAYYASCAILGYTSQQTVIICGDSRQKLGASSRINSCIKNKWGITGEVASWCHAKGIPFINLGWSGDTYTNSILPNAYTERKKLADLGTIIVDCYGVNDIGAGNSYSGTCTSTTTTSVTGASVSGATAAVGDFIEGPTLWPNTRIESGSGATFTISRAPISATTSFTLRRANSNTLGTWQNFIKAFRTMLGAWNKPYFHNTIFPRNLIDLTTAVRTESPATPTINYFNWLLRTGQLSNPVDIGNGTIKPMIDGMVDGASAIVENGNTGIFSTPPNTMEFTAGDGITTTLNSNIVQSTAGSFRPWMTGYIIYIEGAGGANSTNAAAGSTTLRGYVVYLNNNYIALTIPSSVQDNSQSKAPSIITSASTSFTRAGAAVSNALAHINNGNWDIEGLHLGRNGEVQIADNGNFRRIEQLVN
jgi:hypothetical protein